MEPKLERKKREGFLQRHKLLALLAAGGIGILTLDQWPDSAPPTTTVKKRNGDKPHPATHAHDKERGAKLPEAIKTLQYTPLEIPERLPRQEFVDTWKAAIQAATKKMAEQSEDQEIQEVADLIANRASFVLSQRDGLTVSSDAPQDKINDVVIFLFGREHEKPPSVTDVPTTRNEPGESPMILFPAHNFSTQEWLGTVTLHEGMHALRAIKRKRLLTGSETALEELDCHQKTMRTLTHNSQNDLDSALGRGRDAILEGDISGIQVIASELFGRPETTITNKEFSLAIGGFYYLLLEELYTQAGRSKNDSAKAAYELEHNGRFIRP